MYQWKAGNHAPSEVMAEETRDVSLWSRSGPPLLLCACAIFLFREAPFCWPLILTAFLGYATTRLFRLAGLSLALITLAVVSFFLFRSSPERLWITLFSASTALSFFLIYLGGKEAESVVQSREERIHSQEEALENLKQQLSRTNASLRETAAQKEQMERHHAETLQAQAKEIFSAAEEEKRLLVDRCALLTQESLLQQNRAIALFHDLEEARGQLAAEQSKTLPPTETASSIIPQTEVAEEEPVRKELLQSQYAQLQGQFEEKAEALHLTRKELFKVENDYLALQRAEEERGYYSPEEDPLLLKSMQELEGECRDLEAQVGCLQDLVSILLTPKKRPRSKKKKK